MTQDAEGLPTRIQVTSTPELEVGCYADFVGIWHQDTSFVLDFSVCTNPPQLGHDDDGNHVLNIPARMTARVRIPPAQVFEIMKALETQLSAWERETGR